MSHGSQTAEAPARTCPDWCISTHTGGDTIHFQTDSNVADIYGKQIGVSAFLDAETGKAGVYVGSYEFTPEEGAAIAKLITSSAWSAALALLESR